MCTSCGEVATDPARVSVVIDAEQGETLYEFDCPRCHGRIHTVPTSATVELLVALGATVNLA